MISLPNNSLNRTTPTRHVDQVRNNRITRRMMILSGLGTAGLALVVSRLYKLQVADSGIYRLRADNNRLRVRVLAPLRGNIVDRYGRVLARSSMVYRLFILPDEIDDIVPTVVKLQQLLRLNAEQVKNLESRLLQARGLPVMLDQRLSYKQMALISINMPNIPGISLNFVSERYYPYGEQIAHVLGYTRTVDSKNASTAIMPAVPNSRLLLARQTAAAIGVSGLEAEYHDQMFGQPGNQEIEVNAVGKVVRELSIKKPLAGEDLRLTIDAGLQSKAFSLLSQYRAGAVSVLDAHTGAVRALVSVPSFDPSIFTVGVSEKEWQQWREKPLGPFNNRATQALYPPGSIFKIIVMLTALEHNFSVGHKFRCPGYLDVGNTRLHCWKEKGHGNVNLHQALVQSCDVWFYQAMQLLTMDAVAKTAARFGLDSLTGIDLPSERSGFIPTPDWKREEKGVSWVLGDSMLSAIGQGYLLSTPLQMTTMLAAILANRKITPWLHHQSQQNAVNSDAKSENNAPHDVTTTTTTTTTTISDSSLANNNNSGIGGHTKLIDPRHHDILLKALIDVVNTRQGTAYGSRPPLPIDIMAGKTATAQVLRISQGERDNRKNKDPKNIADIAWHHRDHSMFVGYAPLRDPQWVIGVVVEHGGSSSRAAVPLASQLVQYAYNSKQIGVLR